MIRQHANLLRVALLVVDGAMATGLFVLLSQLRFGADWAAAWLHAGGPWWTWAFIYGLLWVGAEWLLQLDQLRSRWTFRGELLDIVRAALLVGVTVFSLLFLVHAPDVSRLFLAALFASQVVFSIIERRFLRAALVLARRLGIGSRYVLVLGTGPVARRVAGRLRRHPALGYRIVGHLGRPTTACPTVLGSLDDVEAVIHGRVIDELVAAFEANEARYLEPLVALAQQEGKRLRLVLTPGVSAAGGPRVEVLGQDEIVTISNGPDRMLSLAVKRLLDIAISGIALVVLAVPFLVLALVVKAGDGGTVLFRQVRIGLQGRPFRMLKFRSMVQGAEARLDEVMAANELSGPAFKLTEDPRITPVGHLLRRTSLDELPQLWNVFRGEMSLVGPRPPLPEEVGAYDLWHRRRLSMKPGITGLWQVSARLEPEFDRWVEMDLRYIDRWTLWLDFQIMARTIPAMLTGR